MELVYLWVEDYKNIHHQGFNFSSRFECEFKDEYDENGKLRDDCELVIKPKEHLKNFFDKEGNINVTAIVGENGSGKSRIFELINNMSYEEPLISPYPISSMELSQIRIYFNKSNNKLYIYYNNITLKITNKSSIITETINKEFDKSTIQKILIPSTSSNSQKEYLLLLDFLINNNVSFPFDIPNMVNFYIHDDYYELLELIKTESFDFDTYYAVFMDDKESRLKIFHILLLLAYLHNYKKEFTIEATKNYDVTIQKLEIHIEKKLNLRIKNFINTIRDHLESFPKSINHLIDKKNIPNDFFKIYIEIIKRQYEDELFDFKGKNVFYFDLYPKMSDGQYQLTYLYNMIYSQINNENILLLIDEGENYLHPNWQKKYINYLYQFCKDNFKNKKIHIILTSHSPFILSDLPKENVIFLKDGKQVDVDMNPFGANIHTLLSHGFFMEGGLMGEFAKNKINEIITFLKNDKTIDEISTPINQIKKVIENIGEEFLKEKLTLMYNKKFPKSKDEQILELQKQITELKKND